MFRATLPCILLALVIGPTTPAAADRPNFILFLADDISWDDIGCYGHPTIKTPHIDRLAASGLRFTNAYLTTSSCSPSCRRRPYRSRTRLERIRREIARTNRRLVGCRGFEDIPPLVAARLAQLYLAEVVAAVAVEQEGIL